MDVLNEWLKEHRNSETIMDGIKRDCVIERIVCKDGTAFLVRLMSMFIVIRENQEYFHILV